MPRKFNKTSDYWNKERPFLIARRGDTSPIHYSRWENMNQRCYNPNAPSYKWYGERGITVYKLWRGRGGYKCFAKYIEDTLKAQPTPKHSIDRIDGNGNYEPGNIRWATQTQQAYNREINVGYSKYKGVSWNKKAKLWYAYITKDKKRISLKYFKNEKDAAKAYNKAALELHGEFARLNEIKEPTGS